MRAAEDGLCFMTTLVIDIRRLTVMRLFKLGLKKVQAWVQRHYGITKKPKMRVMCGLTDVFKSFL